MKKFIFNSYMEHSKNYILLNVILGIMECINTPLKLCFFIIPVVIYVIGVYFSGNLKLPFIPDAITPKYDLFINILLLSLFFVLLMVVIVSIGRNLNNAETKVFREAFEGKRENREIIHLIYKRKTKGNIERRIYSHIVPDEWNDKGVYLKILKIFDEHFETVKFVIDNNNSRVTIMKTREGFIKPEKEEYHDEILDKEMREVE